MASFGLLLALLSAQHTLAQDLPRDAAWLVESPVREIEASAIDVQHARLSFSVLPDSHLVDAHVFFEFLARDSTLRSLRFPAAGLEIREVALSPPTTTMPVGANPAEPDAVTWTVENDTLGVDFPGAPAGSLGLTIRYRIRGALNTTPLGSERGPWKRVWTSFQRGSSSWLLPPPHFSDRFSVELRVDAPESWTVFTSGHARFGATTNGRATVASIFDGRSTFASIGFVAFSPETAPDDASLPDMIVVDRRPAVQRIPSTGARGGEPDGLNAPLSADGDAVVGEFRISLARMVAYFRERSSLAIPDSTVFIAMSGPAFSMSSGAGLTIVSASSLPEGLDPIREDYRLATAVARSFVAHAIPLAGWADVWVPEAFAHYLAADYVRDRHGETAYVDVLMRCRDDYMDESRQYARPLVWDRWYEPEQLLDRHATCKGLWVLHMLSRRHGDDVAWFALQYLAELSKETTITTEEARMAFERASGFDLTEFFDDWAYAAGHPAIDYSYEVSDNQQSVRIVINQTQTGFLVPEAFDLELDVEAASLAGIDRSTIEASDPRQTIDFPVQLRPQYVRLDPDADVLFEYDTPPEASVLVSSLRRQESPGARLAGVWDLLGTAVDASLLVGLRPLMTADNPATLDRLLVELLRRMAPSTSAARELLDTAQDSTATSQAEAIAALASFPDVPEARRVALNAANSASNPKVLAASVEALVRLDSALAWRVLQSAMVTESNGNIVRRTAVGLFADAPADPEAKRDALLMRLGATSDARLKVAIVEALGHLQPSGRDRETLLNRWPVETEAVRSAIVNLFSASVPGETEHEILSRWARVEPSTRIRLQLSRLLEQDSN